MAAIFDEHQQYYDTAGRLLVGGFVYIGEQNQDPQANPVTIYSDRELTTPIANPQTIGADGRTENKIWVDGKYSKKVTDSDGVQQYIELDNGQDSAIGIVSLDDVQGADNVIAVASPVITAYIDKAIYIWVSVQENTGPMTFDGGPGPVPFKKNKDQDIVKGEVNADQVVMMTYNETENVMEWANQNNKVLDFYKGPDIASAATIDPWSTEGNSSTVTGTTQITTFADAPNIGARVFLLFLDAVEIVESVNLILNGGNYTTKAGDILTVYAEEIDKFRVTGISSAASSIQTFETTGTWNNDNGANLIKVYATGAGGGGAGIANGGYPGESGAAGGTAIKIIDVSGISSVAVTVGTAGTGGAAGGNSGTAGTTSSFGTHCSGLGGPGGLVGPRFNTPGPAGGGATGGDINIPGGDGTAAARDPNTNSGNGGPSYWGGGGSGISNSNNGFLAADGRAPGSGGGSASAGGATGGGGDGAPGIVVVEELG